MYRCMDVLECSITNFLKKGFFTVCCHIAFLTAVYGRASLSASLILCDFFSFLPFNSIKMVLIALTSCSLDTSDVDRALFPGPLSFFC